MSSSKGKKTAPTASGDESREKSRAPSPSKSVKSTKSALSWFTGGSGDGIDSGNPESSHDESEQAANVDQYMRLKSVNISDKQEVETYLREKRFYFNQLWQLFSALDNYADEGTMAHATEAARELSIHLSDAVVGRYDVKARAEGRPSLSELAAKDVETEDKRMGYFFSIKDPARYNKWKPDL